MAESIRIRWCGRLRGPAMLGAIALGFSSLPAHGAAGAHAPQETRQWQGTAHWIGAHSDPPAQTQTERAALKSTLPGPLPIFRRGFTVHGKIASATLRISGLGQYEAHINGHNVTVDVLTPAWSDYRKRVFYNTYDVTSLIGPGENAIGVMLGNGMYNVVETKGRYTKFSGSFGRPKLILELDLHFADGGEKSILSDGAWKTAPGPITFTSIYGGEDYDARLEQPGWDQPGFDDKAWLPVDLVNGPGGKLAPETIPPIKAFDRYSPVSITHPRPGVSVYDLGENFAGWPEIDVTGQRGASITLIAGELLDANGLVTQRSANAFPDSRNSFTYVLKGAGTEQWHPRFSYYGFRYIQVETPGPQPITLNNLSGRFLHDAVQIDGHFSSSDRLLNRIHILIDRAMLSNMVSVLTDCPHREKLGWLEQSHLAASSLMYNYGFATLYAKIADDMQDAQLPNGMVPDIAPEFTIFDGAFRDSPEWGSAVILSTWTAYQFYGGLALLRDHYDSMKRYAAYLNRRSHNHLLEYGLGDWYDIGPRPPGGSQLTAKGLTATAIYYQDLTTLVRIATRLDRASEAARYSEEAQAVKQAFNDRFFHSETKQYDTGSQTANAMPLVVGLVPDGSREAVLANLVADIRKHGNHVTAGDIGFHYVVRALTDNARSDVLYDMLSRTDSPSYGYQLARGATTLTEAWNADPDSSQNHFMLGHAEEWFYRGLGGIDFDLTRDTDSRIRIHPAIVGNIQNVTVTFHSALGTIESAWRRNGNTLQMDVTIPSGATGTILLPGNYSKAITVNGKVLKSGEGIRSIEAENGAPAFVVSGGTYRIHAQR